MLVDIRETLNGLIGLCKDSEATFAYGARRSRSFALHVMLQRRALDSRRAAMHLQQQMTQHGGLPREGGTAAGDLRLSWAAVRCALSGQPDLVLIESCERIDTCAELHFDSLLRATLPDSVHTLIEAQCETIRHDRERLHELHERLRSTV
ncbi:PA2169 family four-helix-bundle protein [Aquincola sp. S2]|uniref:PA2169 family four-helix-bundle protein n=1 Tax=Pseudaquabacterium terrae TaxID=2732868 RepID=A0ABX2EHW1_9BURK|nr:PA2169 family four-helix-bundle protein [Aquabacterium terrae]NRF68198.1 PA2169 family four-helix-bundle protein [Aquabacterium terrae]